MKKQSKIIMGIAAGVLLVAVAIIIAVIVASGSDSRNYAKHMESAQRYMDEIQYEQAIAEYKAAIEIEPNNTEAYRALAKLYVQTGDYEAAIAILHQGIEQTGSEELSGYIEEVRAVYGEQKALANAPVQEEKFAVGESRAQEEKQSSQSASLEQSSQESLQEPGTAVGNGAREETVFFNDGAYIISEYDENGNLVKRTPYRADGTIEHYSIYEYDGSGSLVKGTVYDHDGTILNISEYDGNGNRAKLTSYRADGKIDYYVVYERDGSGNLVKMTSYEASGTISEITEFDGNGMPVKTTWYNDDGMIRFYTINEYDGRNHLVKSTTYNSDGSIRSIREP